MKGFQKISTCFLFFLIVASLSGSGSGCDGSSATKKPEKSKVDYFKETQASTITTHGRIKMDSVKEVGGKIEYETDDESGVQKWHVDMTKLADGTYTYGMPEEVK
jgi:hypothetical protein